MTDRDDAGPVRATTDSTSRVVVWTLLAGAVAASIGLRWLSPLVASAPVLCFVIRSWPHLDAVATRNITIRWAVALLLTMLITSVFIPERTLASVPFGHGIEASAEEWLSGSGGPVRGVGWLLVAPVVYAALALVSAGVLGWVALAILVGNAAVHAAFVYARGYNVLQATLVAMPPWQWALLGGAVLSAAPLADLSLAWISRRGGVRLTPAARRQILIAAALFVLAIVLRVGLAGPYTSLVQRWTVG